MGKFWVFMLATAPYQAFFVWAAWWLTYYWLGERRTARAAADAARESVRRPDQAADPETAGPPIRLQPENRNADTTHHTQPLDRRALRHRVEYRAEHANQSDHRSRHGHRLCG